MASGPPSWGPGLTTSSLWQGPPEPLVGSQHLCCCPQRLCLLQGAKKPGIDGVCLLRPAASFPVTHPLSTILKSPLVAEICLCCALPGLPSSPLTPLRPPPPSCLCSAAPSSRNVSLAVLCCHRSLWPLSILACSWHVGTGWVPVGASRLWAPVEMFFSWTHSLSRSCAQLAFPE